MEAWTIRRCGNRKSLDTEDHPHLPDEVIFENILTRVPVSTLMRCCCFVSKHWYKSILHDPQFPITYHAHQSKKDLPFVFYNLNVPLRDDENDDSSSKFPNRNFIFRLEKDYDYERKHLKGYKDINPNVLIFREKFIIKSEHTRMELMGNCNGLVCLSQISAGGIIIVNPFRDEALTIFNPPIIKNGGCIVCCYGFGFDSLTHQYKVVLLILTVKNSEFKCLIFTLGTNSWRETSSSSTTIPSPVTATATNFYKSAIFCGGALFWRTKPSDNNNMLLLSFDLHDENFQVIQLPAECASSSLLEEQYQIIDPLLEFRGSPCVARLEKTILGGGGMCSSTRTSTSICDDQNTSYCYKVHLHILKEYSKIGRPNEQVWIKETFDVPPLSFTTCLSPAAPCFFRNPTSSLKVPPTRIMISSDGRVFLYCFRGGQFIQIYDLQTKSTYVSHYTGFFKLKEHSDVYDQINYHLNDGHIENFMSMLAFIPKGGGGGGGGGGPPPRLDRDELMRIFYDKQRTLHVVGHLGVQPMKSTCHYRLLI